MNQKPKIVDKTVGYLRGGQVRYVSIVDHGANQEPFRVLKRATKEAQGDATMPKKLKITKRSAPAQAAPTISHLTFAKSLYADESTVTEYLTKNNWEGFTVEDTGDTFVVKSNDAYQEGATPIEMEEGITGYVSVKTETSDEADDVEGTDTSEGEDSVTPNDEVVEEKRENTATDACPDCGETVDCGCKPSKKAADTDDTENTDAADTVKKFDTWTAWYSNESELAGVLSDGMADDGLPPGMDEVLAALRTATGNVLKEYTGAERATAIQKLGMDYAALVQAVSDAYAVLVGQEDMSESETKFVKSCKDMFTDEETITKSASQPELAATLESILTKLSALENSVAGAAQDAKAALTSVEEIKAVKSSVIGRKSLLIDEPVKKQDSHLSEQELEERRKDELFAKACR